MKDLSRHQFDELVLGLVLEAMPRKPSVAKSLRHFQRYPETCDALVWDRENNRFRLGRSDSSSLAINSGPEDERQVYFSIRIFLGLGVGSGLGPSATRIRHEHRMVASGVRLGKVDLSLFRNYYINEIDPQESRQRGVSQFRYVMFQRIVEMRGWRNGNF